MSFVQAVPNSIPRSRNLSLCIGIAGGGLMGSMLAWRLSMQGHKVSVFEKDDTQMRTAAGFTAAGMLTPYAEVETADTLIFQLGKRSLELWPDWLADLAAPVRYENNGSLVVAHAHDRQDLMQFKQHLVNKISTSAGQLVELDHHGIARLEPELGNAFDTAVFLSEEAWISTDDFMVSVQDKLAQFNVQWFYNSDVRAVGSGEVVTRQGRYAFDLAIDTRGLGAKQQVAGLRGVRGELLWLYAPEVKITRLVRLMHPRYQIYLVPTHQNNEYILGATQIESDDASAISVRSALELLSAAYSLHPGFAEARIINTKTNCRPALADNKPKVLIDDGLIRINGLFRHGYLLAPAITEQVMLGLSSQSSVGYLDLFEAEF